jgi:shikimate kinase
MTRAGDRAAGAPPNVVLTGFMGSGKTAAGRALAASLDFGFVDTDDLVRRDAGRDIPAIFEQEGEAGFRRREREAIASLAGRTGLVIATGGGAVIDRENAAALRRLGPVVWLRASPETILARLGGAEARPLLAGAPGPEAMRGRIGELLASRETAYAAADLAVDTDGIGPEETAQAILSALEKWRGRGNAPGARPGPA